MAEIKLVLFEDADWCATLANRPEIEGAAFCGPRGIGRVEVSADEVFVGEEWVTFTRYPGSHLRFSWVAVPKGYHRDGWHLDVDDRTLDYFVHDKPQFVGGYVVFLTSPERRERWVS